MSGAAHHLWDPFLEEPVFVLTGDQDWAPEWATEATLRLAHDLGVPLHVFATSASDVMADSDVGIGIHPNFLPGSSHGATPEEAVDHCLGLYPDATTVRSHCFSESTPALRLLKERGLRVDSNNCLYLQPGIVPEMHASGMVRLPVFLEDDIVLGFAGTPPLGSLLPTLFSPGLKILNFHPIHVAANTPSWAAYDEMRARVYGSELRPEASGARGMGDLLVDIVRAVRAEGLSFTPFSDVASSALRRVTDCFPEGLAGWHAV